MSLLSKQSKSTVVDPLMANNPISLQVSRHMFSTCRNSKNGYCCCDDLSGNSCFKYF